MHATFSAPASLIVAMALRTDFALRSAVSVRPETLTRTIQRGWPSGADSVSTSAGDNTSVTLRDLAVRAFAIVTSSLRSIGVVSAPRLRPVPWFVRVRRHGAFSQRYRCRLAGR